MAVEAVDFISFEKFCKRGGFRVGRETHGFSHACRVGLYVLLVIGNGWR